MRGYKINIYMSIFRNLLTLVTKKKSLIIIDIERNSQQTRYIRSVGVGAVLPKVLSFANITNASTPVMC